MTKTKLTSRTEKNKLIQLQELYHQQTKPNLVPNKLYHYIRENKSTLITEAIKEVKKVGLKVAHPRSTTNIIDQKTQRPTGIYFWGQPIKDQVHIAVDISELKLTKLYAFPHQIADTILEIQENYLVTDQFWQQLKEIARPIPFADYQGQFRAEFIYTSDIPPSLLTINQVDSN
ncbi:hypothetical protein [Halanaerobaculum tunisiense]